MTETFDIEKRTGQYVAVRDKIKEIEARHENELKPYKEMLDKLGGVLLQHLNDVNAKSVKTDAGTPYKSPKVHCTTADPLAFWNWLLLMPTPRMRDFMDVKPNKTAIKAYMDEQEARSKDDPNIIPLPPPGVNYSVSQELHVMRSRKNKSGNGKRDEQDEFSGDDATE